jgi:protein SCO1/2
MHLARPAAAASGSGMARVLIGAALAGLALAVTAPLAADPIALDRDASLRASQGAVGRLLTDRELIDQHGRPLHLADLRGRPVVVSFVFTNCTYVCSGLTLHLREVVKIARDVLGTDSFSVLTIGFDSARDTPARLSEFASQRRISDPRWRFASGDAATIRRLTDEIGFSWSETAAGFDHVTQVTLLDADGRVSAQVYGQDFAPPALVEPLKDLVLRRSLEQSPVRGLIDNVRLFCTVYDPAAGRYRFDFSMIAASLPVLLVLGMLAAAIFVASRKPR